MWFVALASWSSDTTAHLANHARRPIYLLGMLYAVPWTPLNKYLTLSLTGLGFNTFQSNLLTIPATAASSKQVTFATSVFLERSDTDHRIRSYYLAGHNVRCRGVREPNLRRYVWPVLGVAFPRLAGSGLYCRV